MRDALAITGAAAVPARAGDAVPAEPPPPARFSVGDLRRASRSCRLALPAIEAAMHDAGVHGRADVGLVVGTGLGNLDDAAAFLEGTAAGGPGSPQRFQRSLPSGLASELAILYGLRGFGLTTTDGVASGETALRVAALALRAGRCEVCLCVAADVDSAPLRRALGELGHSEPPGEGAAAVVLEVAGHAAARGAAALAWFDERPPWHKPDPRAAGTHGSAGLVRAVWAIRSPDIAAPPGIEVRR
jgi:3-oxoacyl-(acyl-carrier-protein) synthase